MFEPVGLVLGPCFPRISVSLRSPSKVVSAPTPYSIQKCPEPQICSEFVSMIVFRVPNQVDSSSSKAVQNVSDPKMMVFQFLVEFLTHSSPLFGTLKNNR